MRFFVAFLLSLFTLPVLAANYAVVSSGGIVVNIVQWDGVTPYTPPAGDTLVLATATAQIGGTYNAGIFTVPGAPTPTQGIVFQIVNPSAGSTVQLPNDMQPQAIQYDYIQPAATLTSLNLDLPISPADGDNVILISTKNITTLNLIAAPGQGEINIVAGTLTAGISQHLTWSAQLSAWFKL